MNDDKILVLIAARISKAENLEDKVILDQWLEENRINQDKFQKIHEVWKSENYRDLSFRQKFNRKYITKGLIQETLGSVVGFAIGLWISNSFTHYVKERRNIKNLYGVLGRKQVVVNEIPEWMQFFLSVILGYIALELINYFFQSKSHIKIWTYIYQKYKS